MRKCLLLIGLLTLACNEPSPKTTTTQSSTTTSKDTTTTVAEEKIATVETLTTDNVIPFLNQYEKENKERFVRIITDYGNIDIELFNETPYHRANFIFLTKQKYFDGTVFHRVVKNFVIQGGNSETWEISRQRATIGSYLLPPDTKKGFKHDRGTISMPSSEIDNPHQFASPYEFFIVCQKPGAYHLDKNYTAFGKVIKGMEIVDKINSYEVDAKEWPLKNVYMKVVVIE